MKFRFRAGLMALAWLALLAARGEAQTGTNAFGARPLLTLAAGVANGTGGNAAATAEPGEPAHLGDPAARSLWWRWQAPVSGLTQVDAIGTAFNTRLAVYTGTLLPSLQRVAANLGSEDAPDLESLVRFQAVAGTMYSICVDGYTDPDTGVTETGAIKLAVRQPGPGEGPANDQLASATVLPGTLPVAATGTIAGASVETGEPDPEPTFTPLGPARTVWYAWTAPATGVVTLQVEADEIAEWEPVAAVYTGTEVAGLNLVDQAETLAFAPAETEPGLLSATFTATAGQTYRIQVGGLAFFTSVGAFELSIGPATRPLQDDFAAAGDAGASLTYAGQGSLLEATREAGEPNHFAVVGGSSSLSSATIWWKWTAPSAGPVTVDTRGSDGDTILAVYRAGGTPATLGGLVLVGGSDDINFDATALAAAHSFNATAGSVYYVAVTGYSQSSRVALHLAMGERRTPYAAWLLGYPGLTGGAAARGADPDGDGLSNLQELFHGTDPLISSYTLPSERALLPGLVIEGSDLVFECGYANDNLIGLSDGLGAGGVPILAEAQSSVNFRTWTVVPLADVGLGTSFAFVVLPLGTPPARWVRFKVNDPNP